MLLGQQTDEQKTVKWGNVSITFFLSLQYYLLFLEHFNPLHTNISMRILHTVLAGRICWTTPEVLQFIIIIPFIPITLMFDSGVILHASYSRGLKG